MSSMRPFRAVGFLSFATLSVCASSSQSPATSSPARCPARVAGKVPPDRCRRPQPVLVPEHIRTIGIRLDDNIDLRVPTGLRFTVWTNPRSHTTFTESDQNGQHIYHWHHANLQPTVGAEAEAAKKKEAKRLRTPDEDLDETKGELPSLGWTTFPDWPAVGTWYRGLIADRTT